MNIKNLKSVRIISHNEHGMKELTLEYQKTFSQWLFRKPNKKETYVRTDILKDTWREKHTGVKVGWCDALAIQDTIEQIEYINKINELKNI